MGIESEPSQENVEGIYEDGDENRQRVLMTYGVTGTATRYSTEMVDIVVEDDEGNRQRCLAVHNFGGGGGGGGTDDYADLTNKPKINNTTLSGNKTGADLGLVDDVQINGTSIVSDGVANIPKTATNVLGVVKMTSNSGIIANTDGAILTSPASEAQILAKTDTNRPIVPSTLNYAVRSVSPACTTITASDTTATLVANTTYAHALSSSGCVYTIVTPTDYSTAYNGFILQLDTTNSASVAFQTDDTPATTISISGNPTIEVGKKYTVTGQFSPLSQEWQLFIISYEAS